MVGCVRFGFAFGFASGCGAGGVGLVSGWPPERSEMAALMSETRARMQGMEAWIVHHV